MLMMFTAIRASQVLSNGQSLGIMLTFAGSLHCLAHPRNLLHLLTEGTGHVASRSSADQQAPMCRNPMSNAASYSPHEHLPDSTTDLHRQYNLQQPIDPQPLGCRKKLERQEENVKTSHGRHPRSGLNQVTGAVSYSSTNCTTVLPLLYDCTHCPQPTCPTLLVQQPCAHSPQFILLLVLSLEHG